MDDFLRKYKEIHSKGGAPTSRPEEGNEKNLHDAEADESTPRQALSICPDNLVDQWKAVGRKKNYLSNYRLYQLAEGGNYQVDFPFNGKRVRKTLGTTNRDEADRRAVELIKAYHKA